MTKNNLTFYDICNDLFRLNDGTYTNDTNTKIKINGNSYGLTSYIKTKNLDLYIDLHRNGEYDLTLKLDNDAMLHQSEGFRGRISNWIYLEINEDTFSIYEYGISKNNEEMCLVKDSELTKKLDNNTYIGYDLETDKTYIYFKKYNVLKESDKLNEDYRKFLYCTTFEKEIKKLNKEILDSINSFDNTLFRELASALTYKLKEDYEKDIESLKELVDIYKEYKKDLNILDKEDTIKDIYDFTNQLINKSTESKQINIKNIIENIDLNDIDELKYLRNNIDSLIKEKEHNIKKKTK